MRAWLRYRAPISVVVCVLSSCAFAQNNTMRQRDLAALQERENQYTEGILTKNTKLLNSVFADSFVDTSASGAISTKSEQLKRIANSPVKIESLHVDQVRTDMYDNDRTAVVTERFKVVYVANGQEGTESGRATDIWVKQKGKWMCVAAHSSQILK